ncbi:hypothetical protein [Micromonospora sp. NPDC006431]|uniref:hypothetical protein n=1 Tax=Micromonospora sp. NPDC006431 TaxID=3364235 RepID=UPI0036A470E3
MAAGMRRRRHEDFLADRVPITVATSPFGTGIDKPNREQLSHPCGHCDNCHGGTSEVFPEDGPFPLHRIVRHAKLGSGMVLGYEQDCITVLFDDVGYKTLSVSVVQSARPAGTRHGSPLTS